MFGIERIEERLAAIDEHLAHLVVRVEVISAREESPAIAQLAASLDRAFSELAALKRDGFSSVAPPAAVPDRPPELPARVADVIRAVAMPGTGEYAAMVRHAQSALRAGAEEVDVISALQQGGRFPGWGA